jgi:hypothetical protein
MSSMLEELAGALGGDTLGALAGALGADNDGSDGGLTDMAGDLLKGQAGKMILGQILGGR